MHRLLILLLGAGLLCQSAFPQELRSEPDRRIRGRRAWLVSLAAVAAANLLDVHSSFDKRERNGILAAPNTQFGWSSAAIKAGIVAPVVGYQLWWHKRHPTSTPYRAFTITNFCAAGLVAGVAAHNYSIATPARQ
jgi:hypothetical protein